jgi:N-acetylneuraminate synthase
MSKIFIIAECGINHNGDINIAKQLIKGAHEAGADAVKFQKRTINKVYSVAELDKYRESPWGKTNRQQKEGLELTKNDYDVINAYCKALGIEWFASAWDMESIEFLKQYNLKYNKVPSALLTYTKYLNAIAEQGKYTYIATGMSTTNEIQEAVYVFRQHNCPFELMHCNSTYPMKDEDANLKCIEMLRKVYNCPVGYSGHEVGIIVSVAAAALGATSIERHITLGRSMYGSDQSASLELVGFERMIKYIRAVESSMGDGIKRVTEAEEICKTKLRRNEDY